MPILIVDDGSFKFISAKEYQMAKTKTPKTVPEPAQPSTPFKLLEGFSVGADPELFVQDADGKFVCADMIPGTKDEPYKVEFGAVQRDGFAAEYNIDPASTFEEWNRNHKAVQGQLQSMLPKGFKLVAAPSVRFSPDVFDAAPDMAKELGCSPDWNAWTNSLNPPPKLPDDPYLRCSGGHVHIGWTHDEDTTDVQHMINGFDLTKQLDFFLGAWSLHHDSDVERRRLYGRAGACRIKPYGVEYRVLSSFWTMDKGLRLEVWNRVCKALECMRTYFIPDNNDSVNMYVQTSINQGKIDKTLAIYANFPVNALSQSIPSRW